MFVFLSANVKRLASPSLFTLYSFFRSGVALLSHPYDASKAGEKKRKKEEGNKTNSSSDHLCQPVSNSHVNLNSSLSSLKKPLVQHSARRTDAPAGARQIRFIVLIDLICLT